jgi:hypothetical protein
VRVEPRALHGQRDLGGQRPERVHDFGLRHRGAAAKHAEDSLERVPAGQRHAHEPLHALGPQEIRPARARVARGVLDHDRIPVEGDPARQSLAEAQLGRQAALERFQNPGGAAHPEAVVVADPHEDEAVGHQLGGRPAGRGQHLAQAQRGGHRAGEPRQQATIRRDG